MLVTATGKILDTESHTEYPYDVIETEKHAVTFEMYAEGEQKHHMAHVYTFDTSTNAYTEKEKTEILTNVRVCELNDIIVGWLTDPHTFNEKYEFIKKPGYTIKKDSYVFLKRGRTIGDPPKKQEITFNTEDKVDITDIDIYIVDKKPVYAWEKGDVTYCLFQVGSKHREVKFQLADAQTAADIKKNHIQILSKIDDFKDDTTVFLGENAVACKDDENINYCYADGNSIIPTQLDAGTWPPLAVTKTFVCHRTADGMHKYSFYTDQVVYDTAQTDIHKDFKGIDKLIPDNEYYFFYDQYIEKKKEYSARFVKTQDKLYAIHYNDEKAEVYDINLKETYKVTKTISGETLGNLSELTQQNSMFLTYTDGLYETDATFRTCVYKIDNDTMLNVSYDKENEELTIKSKLKGSGNIELCEINGEEKGFSEYFREESDLTIETINISLLGNEPDAVNTDVMGPILRYFRKVGHINIRITIEDIYTNEINLFMNWLNRTVENYDSPSIEFDIPQNDALQTNIESYKGVDFTLTITMPGESITKIRANDGNFTMEYNKALKKMTIKSNLPQYEFVTMVQVDNDTNARFIKTINNTFNVGSIDIIFDQDEFKPIDDTYRHIFENMLDQTSFQSTDLKVTIKNENIQINDFLGLIEEKRFKSVHFDIPSNPALKAKIEQANFFNCTINNKPIASNETIVVIDDSEDENGSADEAESIYDATAQDFADETKSIDDEGSGNEDKSLGYASEEDKFMDDASEQGFGNEDESMHDANEQGSEDDIELINDANAQYSGEYDEFTYEETRFSDNEDNSTPAENKDATGDGQETIYDDNDSDFDLERPTFDPSYYNDNV